jgi:hypothetical protein
MAAAQRITPAAGTSPPSVEDFEDLEQHREFVEGKSLLHPFTTCILITSLFIYCLHQYDGSYTLRFD